SPRRQDIGHFAAPDGIEMDNDDESSAGVGGHCREKILQRANAARRRAHRYNNRLISAVAAFLIRHALSAKVLVFFDLYLADDTLRDLFCPSRGTFFMRGTLV